EHTVSFQRRGRGARKVLEIRAEKPPSFPAAGRVPRVARLLALAHRLDELVRSGQVVDRAALARAGNVSQARIAHIASLLHLAPPIQEEILFLPPTARGRDPIHLAQLLPIARTHDWRVQQRLWSELRAATVDVARPGA